MGDFFCMLPILLLNPEIAMIVAGYLVHGEPLIYPS